MAAARPSYLGMTRPSSFPFNLHQGTFTYDVRKDGRRGDGQNVTLGCVSVAVTRGRGLKIVKYI